MGGLLQSGTYVYFTKGLLLEGASRPLIWRKGHRTRPSRSLHLQGQQFRCQHLSLVPCIPTTNCHCMLHLDFPGISLMTGRPSPSEGHLRVEDLSHTRSPESWVDMAAGAGAGAGAAFSPPSAIQVAMLKKVGTSSRWCMRRQGGCQHNAQT